MKSKIIDRIYTCNSCTFNYGNEVVFYDSDGNKENIKVMIIYQDPGGKPGDDAAYIENFSAEEKASYHRKNFPAWLASYYTYHLEIFRYLERDEYVSQHLTYFENPMKEIYFTDARKCRITKSESRQKVSNSIGICSYNYLIQEIDELPNLELIIACGTPALDALREICKIPVQAAIMTNKPLKSYENPYSKTRHGEVYDFKFKKRDWINVIHFAHPSWVYNHSRISAPDRENTLLKQASKFVFDNIKKGTL